MACEHIFTPYEGSLDERCHFCGGWPGFECKVRCSACKTIGCFMCTKFVKHTPVAQEDQSIKVRSLELDIRARDLRIREL